MKTAAEDKGRILPARASVPHADYARRMNRVLDHIDQHLDQPLVLEALAGVANFSAFHFHRVFAGWIGETLGDYLLRRRLERAAHLLGAEVDRPVLDIALAVGFGSGEAFARAFKRRFGCTPTCWRQQIPERWAMQGAQAQRNFDQAAIDGRRHHGDSSIATEIAPMSARITHLAPTRVAYRRRFGAYGAGVGAWWRREVLPWMDAHGLQERTCYGIIHDDPHLTEAAHCRYDAAVEVDADFLPGADAVVTTLPGGDYALLSFAGDSSAIVHAWTRVFREWLPASGMQCDARPIFSRRFPGDASQPDGRFVSELCLPVRAL